MKPSGGGKQRRKHLSFIEKHNFVIDHSRLLDENGKLPRGSLAGLLKKYGIRRGQAYDIIKNYNTKGSDGLARKIGSGRTTKMTDKVVGILKAVQKETKGTLSVPALTERINEKLYSHEIVSDSTVSRWLKKNPE
eukprot:m.8897 g.8897  ORF g.8897 m.8897 type:complete len:135 (+) comp7086_c0_seq1:90-494(+)